ncbi:MAG: Crp/Fnr family transcriptional regulator [Janthinobacterium lividum]
MTDALLRKLGSFCPLNLEDAALIADIADRPHIVAAHDDIIREGDVPRDVHLITSGFAIRYKLLPNGARQILAYLLPGDFCDLHVFALDEMTTVLQHSRLRHDGAGQIDPPKCTLLAVPDLSAVQALSL